MISINAVPTKKIRKYLKSKGWKYKGTKGSHEHWEKEGCKRPITFQRSKKEFPIFVIKNLIDALGIEKEEFLDDIRKL